MFGWAWHNRLVTGVDDIADAGALTKDQIEYTRRYVERECSEALLCCKLRSQL
jgi:hypothetical protein